jgi:hypothetical protein
MMGLFRAGQNAYHALRRLFTENPDRPFDNTAQQNDLAKAIERIENLEWQTAWLVETVGKMVEEYNDRHAAKCSGGSVPASSSNPKETTVFARRRSDGNATEYEPPSSGVHPK